MLVIVTSAMRVNVQHWQRIATAPKAMTRGSSRNSATSPSAKAKPMQLIVNRNAKPTLRQKT